MFVIEPKNDSVIFTTDHGDVIHYESLEQFVKQWIRYIYMHGDETNVQSFIKYRYVEGPQPKKVEYNFVRNPYTGAGEFVGYIKHGEVCSLAYEDGTYVKVGDIIRVAYEVLEFEVSWRRWVSNGAKGRKSKWYRKVTTLGALKMAAHVFKEEGEPEMRPSRSRKQIRTSWDDLGRACNRDRNWKKYRQHQWK